MRKIKCVLSFVRIIIRYGAASKRGQSGHLYINKSNMSMRVEQYNQKENMKTHDLRK